MPPDGFHPPLEEYLETILALEEEGTDVIQARLVERLEHSPQSVSEMVRRLEDGGFVKRRRRSVELTVRGRDRAESVVRKHRLAERFLVDVVGLAWAKAHVEAGRWEHVISDEVEARFVEILGNPSTCPHGNPIPGAPPVKGLQHPLSDATEGETVRLARITERVEVDAGSLEYLSESGFLPGVRARVLQKAPDGTFVLEVAGTSVAFGADISRQLYVEALPA